MLNSVPKQIVLTLQSSPPFLLEIILAITIALLLSIPLITRLQYFLGYVEEPLASFDLYNPRRHIHEPISSSTSGSNESLSRYPLRHVNSSPDIKNSYLSTFTMDINPSYHHGHNHNSIDYPISVAYDYGYYRHKLIETNLKQHYGNQAPGNVVLNSLHLSSIDSQTDLRLSEKYNHSFFELIPEPADPYQEKRDQLITIIHPRDHFLRKGARRHESVDKSTETLFISNVNYNYNNDTDDSELKERLPSPRQIKNYRIKKDRSSNDNVKVFKFKIDSNEFNSRPMSPFKEGKSADGDSSPRSSSGKIAKNLNEGKVKKTRKQRREIKAGIDNFKEITSDKNLIKGDDGNNGGQYDLLTIEENSGVGGNLNNSEVELENFERKISSMTIQLNVGSKNNLGDDINGDGKLNLTGNRCEGESKNGKNFECSLNEEVEEKVKKDVEVEKCLAAVSDVLSSQSYYGSSGVTGTATVTGTVTGVGARDGVGAGSGSGIGYGGQREIEKRSRPNTSSGVLTRAFKHLTPKVNSRPRSSGGGFAWEVPDISGKVWSDDNSQENKNKSKTPTTPTRMRRPRSANPQIYRKKSDPVLPVLESIIDLTFDMTADMLDPFSADCQAKGEDKNPPLELKHSVSGNLNGDDTGGKGKIKNNKSKAGKLVSRKIKPDKLVSQDNLSQKKPFLRSRSGKYSVLKVTKFKSKK